MYAQNTNNETCTRKQYCFFVVRHVGKARLDTLVTLDSFVSTCSTGSTKSNVSSRVELSQVEFGLYLLITGTEFCSAEDMKRHHVQQHWKWNRRSMLRSTTGCNPRLCFTSYVCTWLGIYRLRAVVFFFDQADGVASKTCVDSYDLSSWVCVDWASWNLIVAVVTPTPLHCKDRAPPVAFEVLLCSQRVSPAPVHSPLWWWRRLLLLLLTMTMLMRLRIHSIAICQYRTRDRLSSRCSSMSVEWCATRACDVWPSTQ